MNDSKTHVIAANRGTMKYKPVFSFQQAFVDDPWTG